MPLLPILLVAAVLAVDGGLRPFGVDWGLSNAQIAIYSCAPVALVMLFTWVGSSWCSRRLARGKIGEAVIMADRIGRVARGIIVVNHLVAVLVLNWLGAVRSVMGNPILLDELVAILPAIIGLIGIWWAHYPVERRLHDALLIRRLDEGRSVYPTLGRWQYVLLQLRMQVLLVLVPVLAIAMLSELFTTAARLYHMGGSAEWIVGIGKIAAGAGVFMLAPLLARAVLDVSPMAVGPMRENLVQICRSHHVKIRELLVWHTNGSMFNAAVMGIIGRLRYVLITDALLETLPDDQLRAVMAHEIGHVRRHHMFWLVGCLMACFMLVGMILEFPVQFIDQMGLIRTQWMHDAIGIGLSGAELAAGLILFGWVCRRFERQADTFAVQHLSAINTHAEPLNALNGNVGLALAAAPPTSPPARHGVIKPEAVNSMCEALHSIAELNTIDLHRPSWRHGSIAWRMEYLVSIINRPIASLPIDRLIRVLKVATAIILVIGFGLALYDYIQYGITP